VGAMPYARVGTRYEVGLQEFGEAILTDAFRAASKVFLQAMTPTWEAASIAQSVAFVQGSGLETVIRMFDLKLDPETLRETFTWKCNHVRSSALSSATIVAG